MKKRLVHFIHGLGGTPEGTWGNFEKILTADRELEGLTIGYFTYPTSPFRWLLGTNYPSIQTLAEALDTQIENSFRSFDDITLVCHSLGGLIGKQYLINRMERKQHLKVQRSLFYAVPHNGSSLASVGDLVAFRHRQLRQLCKESDVVRQIAKSWQYYHVESAVDVRYVIAALDRVVDEQSARESWSNDRVEVIPNRGHRDIVKPIDADDLSYLVLKNLLYPASPGSSEVSGDRFPKATPPEIKPAKTTSASAIPEEMRNNTELRVAVSAIVRIERDGSFLLIRNTHRPESFAPIGGVYKFFQGAKPVLDKFDFRPQSGASDLLHDIRGYISPNSFEEFREWFLSGTERESGTDCLRREVMEECTEIGLKYSSELLEFKNVRSVTEGPEFIRSQGRCQFRIFDVFDLVENTEPTRSFMSALETFSSSSNDLLWATSDQIIRGRAKGSQIIASHAAYLFGKERYREGDPPFWVG